MVAPNPAWLATNFRLSPVGVPPPTPPAGGDAVEPTRRMAKSTAWALACSCAVSSESTMGTSTLLVAVQKLLGFPLVGSVMVEPLSCG